MGDINSFVYPEAPSKSSKRNAKRRAKKKATEEVTVTETISPTVEEDVVEEEEPPVVVPVDPITALKRQLEEAKAVKVADCLSVCLFG